MRILRSAATATRTLTALPVPGKDTQNIGDVFFWFPVVGGGIGLLAAVLGSFLSAFPVMPSVYGNAFAVVVFLILITRGFHLDGVADWADAFWGGYDRERTLAIMKDSNIGTFGALGLIIVVLGKWIGISACLQSGQAGLLVPALVLSRTGQVTMGAFSSYARREGGTGAAFVDSAKPMHAGVAVIVAALISLAVLNYLTLITVFLFWFVIVFLFAGWCRKRLGGVTGDLLGAGSEITEMLLLLLLPAIL